MEHIRTSRRIRPIAWGTCALLANCIAMFAIFFSKKISSRFQEEVDVVVIFSGWILMWAILSLRSRDLLTDGLALVFALLTFVFLGVRIAEQYSLLPRMLRELPVDGQDAKSLFICGWFVGVGLIAVSILNRRKFSMSKST
jgi:hypothetical protein